jgi:hypothetical protein
VGGKDAEFEACGGSEGDVMVVCLPSCSNCEACVLQSNTISVPSAFGMRENGSPFSLR